MMKLANLMLLIAAGLFFMTSCKKTKDEENSSSPNLSNQFTDTRDGNIYKTVKIGNQIWMAENLRYYTDGSICYDNNPNNCTTYGVLYNWDQASTACPDNYKLPSDEDWKTLEMFLGMSQSDADMFCLYGPDLQLRGTDQGTKLKAGGSSGFNALFSGYETAGYYIDKGSRTFFWTSTKKSDSDYYLRDLESPYSSISREALSSDAIHCCVRCLMK